MARPWNNTRKCTIIGAQNLNTHTLFQPSTAGSSMDVAWRNIWLMIYLSYWSSFHLFHTGDTLPFLPPFASPDGLPDTLLKSPRASCNTCCGVTSGLPEPVICLVSGGLQSIHCTLRHLLGIINTCRWKYHMHFKLSQINCSNLLFPPVCVLFCRPYCDHGW